MISFHPPNKETPLNRLKKLILAALILVGGVIPFATGKVSALENCSAMNVYNTGYARCTSYGYGGHVRVWVTCKVPGSTQQYLLYGPWVGVNTWSTKECPWPMVLTDRGYSRGS